MLPNSKSREFAHRERKRHIEIKMATKEISGILKNNNPALDNNETAILEFGCGDGFQIPYLKQLGNVIASDIYSSDRIKNLHGIRFVQCDISDTPFDDGQFDIVFSNHVLEHISDIEHALLELKRIGTPSCIYAFSVPTNIWLLLTIPAQYRIKYQIIKNFLLKPAETSALNTNKKKASPNKSRKKRSFLAKSIRFIVPWSHGISPSFIQCYRKFKIESWQQLLSDNGFTIIKTKPLLLYGPSEWPIIPTSKNKKKLCSSVLFLMRKNGVPITLTTPEVESKIYPLGRQDMDSSYTRAETA
jgi:ubiquinone/menaquinone biosynthesis C-methylase UbiE